MERLHWVRHRCRQLLGADSAQGCCTPQESHQGPSDTNCSPRRVTEKRRIVCTCHGSNQKEFEAVTKNYKTNAIRTTKYSLLSFIPMNLFQQFHRAANLYFLFLALLNWVPVVEAFQREITMIPLVVVLTVIAIKDALEDYRRYLFDKKVNNNVVQVYSYIDHRWKDVRVGDFVRLSCNEIIPADMLLLYSSDPRGICYIETANLDGETNLKQREVISDLPLQGSELTPENFHSRIECEQPNNDLRRFRGYIEHSSGLHVGLRNTNLLLRSCTIRNTEMVIGIVIYAGHETKAMMNNSGPRYKRSSLERRLNTDILWCVFLLLIMCLIAATGHGLWLKNLRDPPFQVGGETSPALGGFYVFWTMIIVLQVLIPISLYVSIEIVKLGQIYFIHNDLALYNEQLDSKIQCRALNITEDLGQIQYLFSDKTGTLTENKMVFRRCSIFGRNVITDSELEGKLNWLCPSVLPDLSSESPSNVELTYITDFFLALAICNSVVVSSPSQDPHLVSEGQNPLRSLEETKLSQGLASSPWSALSNIQDNHLNFSSGMFTQGKMGERRNTKSFDQGHRSNLTTSTDSAMDNSRDTNPCEARHSLEDLIQVESSDSGADDELLYEAESPDEAALVHAARAYRCILRGRTAESLLVDLPGFGCLSVQLLHTLPFDSNRKRMSVVVRHPLTQQVVVYTKGADSVIMDLSETPKGNNRVREETQKHVNFYAREGLRTLCIARKILEEGEYKLWQQRQLLAEKSIENREQMLLESAQRLETNLTLLGTTGIVDRLQEEVPETIEALQRAGIRVWVLTGDKQETAINIAYACKLIHDDDQLLLLHFVQDACGPLLEELKVEAQCRTDSWTEVPGGQESSSGRVAGFILIIDGLTLDWALQEEVSGSFLELSCACRAVICCRSTPLQKSQVVQLIRTQLGVMTLSVGDGANDVSMIQVADVGIGISGQEGMQAVMSSDFAISRFKHLSKLLLVHGHWCYSRLTHMILYFIYKNVMFVNLLFWYQFFCGFSGSVMTNSWVLILFNLIFTAIPPLIYGILDQNTAADTLMGQPELYRTPQLFSPQMFWITVLDGFYQSLVCFFVPYFALAGSDVGELSFGSPINASALLIILLHQVIESNILTWIHGLVLLLSAGSYVVFVLFFSVYCVSCSPPTNPLGVETLQMSQPLFYIICALTTVTALLPRYSPSEILTTYTCFLSQHTSQSDTLPSISPVRLQSPAEAPEALCFNEASDSCVVSS
uniref:Phospholipid-transporting ATPase n=1 Tax=Salarias fasciatus TaxID=181472 RepID=A0A672HEM9_SALFA